MEYRETILSLLEEGLRNNPAVHALWLEGADGLGTTDEYSDLDIWLDVADGREEDILELCLSLLEPVGKPGKATPQTRPLEQVILGEKSTRYSNIDQILAKPAYQSRKAQFIVEMPAGRKEVLKEEKGAAERAEENRSESLFD